MNKTTEAVQIDDQDNWKHRSTSMKCNACMYWKEKMIGEKQSPLGRCRRNAPTMKGWPALFASDWCGEHKLDENKI